MLRQIKHAQEAAADRWGLDQSINDPQIYVATFIPPAGSVYHDGVFYANITLNGYPIYPPRVQMTTKIFHPNFSQDGQMHVEVLYSDYNMTFTLLDLMEYIYGLFINPDPDILSQCNSTASELYKNDSEKFKAIAQEWTVKYAI
jgi:ubiquitin-protein ligase